MTEQKYNGSYIIAKETKEKEVARNYFIGIILGVMIIGGGIGIIFTLVPFLAYGIIDGLVIIIIGMVVMFILKQKLAKSGYKIVMVKVVKNEG